MRIPVILRTKQRTVKIHTLVDSGAQGKFINRITARQLRLKEEPLPQPIMVYNVDRTPNKLGFIRNTVTANVDVNGRITQEKFFITQIGKQDIILGIDWLQRINPVID